AVDLGAGRLHFERLESGEELRLTTVLPVHASADERTRGHQCSLANRFATIDHVRPSGPRSYRTLSAGLKACSYDFGATVGHAVNRWYASAARSSVGSSNGRAVSWKPTGTRSPPRSTNPPGTLIAGTPARFALTVKISARYICSGSSAFSPRPNGGMGLVGV